VIVDVEKKKGGGYNQKSPRCTAWALKRKPRQSYTVGEKKEMKADRRGGGKKRKGEKPVFRCKACYSGGKKEEKESSVYGVRISYRGKKGVGKAYIY